jgi:hypothetical protein
MFWQEERWVVAVYLCTVTSKVTGAWRFCESGKSEAEANRGRISAPHPL